MSQPEITVQWEGSTPPGQPVNPISISVPPLVAGLISVILNSPQNRAAAAEHPRAYAGLIELTTKINAAIALDGSQNPVHFDVPPVIPGEVMHREVQRGIDAVPGEAGTVIDSGRPIGYARSPQWDQPRPPAQPRHLLNSQHEAQTPVQYAPGRVRVPGAGEVRQRQPRGSGIGRLANGAQGPND